MAAPTNRAAFNQLYRPIPPPPVVRLLGDTPWQNAGCPLLETNALP